MIHSEEFFPAPLLYHQVKQIARSLHPFYKMLNKSWALDLTWLQSPVWEAQWRISYENTDFTGTH